MRTLDVATRWLITLFVVTTTANAAETPDQGVRMIICNLKWNLYKSVEL
ncbi:hypothetical protein ACFL5F_04835 [Planctomycetota bacterium]